MKESEYLKRRQYVENIIVTEDFESNISLLFTSIKRVLTLKPIKY